MPAIGIITFSFLILFLVFINMLQMLSVVVIRPFSLPAFRKFNSACADLWWGWCTSAVQILHGVRLEVTGDELTPEMRKENSIVIMNHQSMADITVLLMYAKAQGRLGDLKWYVKDVLKYVPGVGWGMVFLDCLFIKRNWTDDKDKINDVFAKIIKYKIPVWVVSFLEGTRFTPAKRDRSQAYASKNGLPILKHVLIPRTKGFVATVQGLESHLQAVYDMTIGYVGKTPTLKEWIQGKVKVVHLNIRRFPIASLPKEEKALSDWAIERFKEKDRLLDQFYQQTRSDS